MPAAAIFLADGHVLSAHDLAALLKLRDADIAADALADVLDTAFRNLGRQEGIRNRWAGGADDVQHTRAYQCDHVVGTGEPAIADHGDAGPQNGLALFDERGHPAGFAKARDRGVLPPLGVIADLQSNRVDHAFFAEQLEQPHTVLVGFDTFGAVQGVDLESRGDCAAIAQSQFQRVQQLDEERERFSKLPPYPSVR